MIKAILTAFVVLIASATQGFTMDSLSQYTWKNRVLLLFGPSTDDRIDRQIDLILAQKAALADRDMVVLHISADSVRKIYGNAERIDAQSLSKEAGVEGGEFQVILVGKDGGIKLRSKDVISDAEMFDLIDRMPMRRAEQG